jgi:mono/diheme cytochrome c family protein
MEVCMAGARLLGSVLLLVAVCLIVPAAVLTAAEKPAFDLAAALMGSKTFRTYCASCHGGTGHGDGPLAGRLRFAPPDLTEIAKRNAGKFAFDKIARIIDGREPVKGHGGPDMPIWGDAFSDSRDGYDAVAVKQKINQLVHYLASLQEGAGPSR